MTGAFMELYRVPIWLISLTRTAPASSWEPCVAANGTNYAGAAAVSNPGGRERRSPL